MTRGHEIRQCYKCGSEFKVYNSDASAGAGKYCSVACAIEAKSRWDAVAAMLPNTVYGVAAALDIPLRTAAHSIQRMCRAGVAHPSGITKEQHREFQPRQASHALVYSVGASADEEIPIDNLKTALSVFYDRAVLAAMPGTQAKIMRKTGLGQSLVMRRIDALRAAGKTHIKGWQRAKQGPYMAVHEAGAGTDTPCNLEPIPRNEKYQRWKIRAAKNGGLERAKKRQSQWRKEKILRTVTGDPLINALFGAPKERLNKGDPA